jgi:2-hydroxy-6-oxonona-2,4-dienedioate hydrolase
LREVRDQPRTPGGPQIGVAADLSSRSGEAFAPVQALNATARVTRTASQEGFAVWREWGEGRPLVFFHGGAGSWMHFVHQIAPFAQGRRVIAVDLPGFGDASDSPSAADPEMMARILASGLETVLGREPFDLAAFSFGSIVAGYLARSMSERISGLVLIGAVGMGLRRHTVDLASWRALTDRDERRAVHRRNLASLMIKDPSRIDDLAVLVQEANAERSRLKTRPVAHREPLSQAIDGAGVRLAAIWGEHDQLSAPFFEERRGWLRARDPDAAFVIIPDAGHWVQYEVPDAFNAALRDCLQSFERRA